MANRGLSDEEIALAKGMIALRMKRDVVHSFFVSPGRPITPAFVSEIQTGKIGKDIKPANEEVTRAYISSRVAFSNSVTTRSDRQFDLFGDLPDDKLAPHRFNWAGTKLVHDTYLNYSVRGNKRLELLHVEAVTEVLQVVEDSAVANHPRFRRRVSKLLEALPKQLEVVDPIKAGMRAKGVMNSLQVSGEDFSAEFIGEVTAAVSSVFMFVSHYEEWREFELTVASTELAKSELFVPSALKLVEELSGLPNELVDSEVVESLGEFLQTKPAMQGGHRYDPVANIGQIDTSLKASLNYSAIATINQFASILIRTIRDAGSRASQTAVAIAKAIRSGALEGLKVSSTVITSSVILYFTITHLRAIAEVNQGTLGWLIPFTDRLDDIFAQNDQN